MPTRSEIRDLWYQCFCEGWSICQKIPDELWKKIMMYVPVLEQFGFFSNPSNIEEQWSREWWYPRNEKGWAVCPHSYFHRYSSCLYSYKHAKTSTKKSKKMRQHHLDEKEKKEGNNEDPQSQTLLLIPKRWKGLHFHQSNLSTDHDIMFFARKSTCPFQFQMELREQWYPDRVFYLSCWMHMYPQWTHEKYKYRSMFLDPTFFQDESLFHIQRSSHELSLYWIVFQECGYYEKEVGYFQGRKQMFVYAEKVMQQLLEKAAIYLQKSSCSSLS